MLFLGDVAILSNQVLPQLFLYQGFTELYCVLGNITLWLSTACSLGRSEPAAGGLSPGTMQMFSNLMQ